MRRIIETAHHQGESIIQHARKHHKKYLWGAAGIFGIFKLFSFLIVSVLSYTTIIAANIPSTTSIVIPATTIDIQEGKSIIQFDLSDVDIGNYTSIQNIDLRMDIETQEKTVDIETLWNSITTSIGQPSSTNMLAIQLWAADKDTRTINPENISGIIQQLQSGNTIAYFLPQENINIQSGTIVMEIEVATQQEVQQENEGTGIVLFEGLGKDTIVQQSKSLEKEIKQYEKIKKNIITKKDTTLIKDAKTLENIQLESDDQKIQVKIPKDTKLMTKKEMDFEGSINQPQEIALDALSSKPQSKGIYAFEVGDPEQSIHFKKEDNTSQNIDITIYIESGSVSSGEYVHVYYSEDQIIWNTLGNSIIHQDEEGKFYLNIQVDHMTTFYIGTDEFSFFLSDAKCANDLSTILRDGKGEWPVYACMQGSNSAAVKSFRLSDKDTTDLESKSRDVFNTPYNKFSTFGIDTSNFWGPITLYAQYAYDEKDYKTRGTTSDQIIVARQGDFSFYISDDGCGGQTTSAVDQSILYLCTNGAYSDFTTDLRISTVSEKDLMNQNWQGGYDTAYEFLLSGEGKTTVYVEYKYTADQEYRSEIVSYPMTIVKTSQSNTILSGTIANGESLDVSNKYRIISSPDGISSLTLNSADKSSTIVVSQSTWDGTLSAPSLITAGTKKASQGETGLAKGFVPTNTYEVGDDVARLSLSGANFTVSLLVTDERSIGKSLKIYSSQDGITWTDENKTCIVNANRSCNFSTSHLTLFTVGSITRDNLQFVNQDFRTAGPTNVQVFDAFFGTGGNPSAYTTHWTGSCYPTSIVNRNPGTRGATNLAANTIYILSSGNYIQNGTLTMNGSCIAIVGRGNVTIDTLGSIVQTVYANNKTGIIIDNIHFNNSGTTNYGITLNNQTTNITINDIQANKYVQFGIYLLSTTNSLINNCQGFNNNVGFDIQSSLNSTINNSQAYNNIAYGIFPYTSSGVVINNTQIYNNSNYGIYAYVTTGLVINNSQIYNNSIYGIVFNYTPNILLNNTKIFKNSTNGPILLSNSNATYYGKNEMYPNANLGGLIAGGNNPGGLGWTAGTVSTTDPGFSCNFVTNPVNGFGTGLFTTSNCSNLGRVTTRTGKEIVTYNYGNNMLSGQYVLRQIRPVAYSAGSLILSSIPYHGHRFIGEYDDPSGKDKNTPVILFTGETPTNGFNLINTGFYTLRSYIYEPNLSSLHLSDRSGADFTSYYPYDSSLIFMVNFDKVEEIGETNTLVKDLSLNKNSGTVSGATWTENGKWNGAYIFNGTNNFIGAANSLPSNSITIQLWFKTNASVRGILFGQSNAIPPTAAGAFVPTIVMQANGKIRTEFWVGAITSGVTPAAYNDNQWHQITVVGSGTTQTTYIDGTIVESHTTATSINNSRRTKSTIGVGYDSVDRGGSATMWKYFSGYIDEPRVRNRALNASEIYTMYNSNLSAKADHREYVKNYTGIYSRPYGDFNYTFEYTDSDNNGGETTRNLNKYQTCTRTNWRNNDNFITGGFWTHNPAPTDCDIIAALYGTGTDGSDLTAYTSNWTGRNGSCNYTSLNVVHITGGTDKLSPLAGNTIYVLTSGDYIQSTTSRGIGLANCMAVIGQTGTTKIHPEYSPAGHIEVLINMGGQYSILDALTIAGTPARYGIVIEKNSNTINNINIYGNATGVVLSSGNNYNKISNSTIFNNSDGISIQGANNIIANSQIYSNTLAGISIQGATNNTISDSQIYSNTLAGISIQGATNHLTLNNLQSFNNAYGMQTANDSIHKDYISLNNSQIYNNANDGLLLYYTRYFAINNSHLYNNNSNGIYFAGTANSNGIVNNISAYNNGSYGIRSEGGSHIRYGKLTIFDNGLGSILTQAGSISAGSASTYSSLGRTGGTTDTTQCMNCSRATNPVGSLYTNLIDATTYPKCNLRGNNTSRTATGDLSYKYGISLTGQKQPVFRSGTTLRTSSLPYSGTKYVAEINNIGTYTDNQCSCTDVTYTWNNNNFVDSGFWNNLPTTKPYCHIIAALYGSGTSGTDGTAYTQLWSGRNGQCNPENMKVIYTGVIPQFLSTNTIYVINSGIYNISTSRNLENCSALITSGNVLIKKNASVSSIYASGKANAIIDNIKTDANKFDWGGIGLTQGSNNNTINNVQTYNNAGYFGNGIVISYSSNNNTVNNSQSYNNSGYGIFIGYTSNNNTINNVQSYNNIHGITVDTCRYNTINNAQSYNNSNNGIRIFSSLYNTINNTQAYNNGTYGISINNSSSNNNINNSKSFNNDYGINVDTTNNKYYSSNSFFENRTEDIWGYRNLTAGSSNDYPGFGRTNGSLSTTDSISRDNITNPINESGDYLLSWTDQRTGIQGSKIFTSTPSIKYSYGSGISTQIQPVYYSGTALKTGGIFSGVQFIGSNLVKITGDLSGVPSTTTTPSLSVVGISNSSLVSKYSVFGDILGFKIGQAKNTSTGIDLITGLSINRIITQLFDPSGYFAMHFQKQTEIVSLCLSGWDNDNFIDDTFRAQNPTDNNIICALYGSGVGDTTAYTKTWPSYQGDCSVSNGEIVKYASNPETTPLAGMGAYTVYIFPSGTYNLYHDIELKNCVAFISTGATTINGSTYSTIVNTAYNVIDNLNIDGGGTSNNGVVKFLNNNKGSTIHGMNIYNGNYGVYAYNSQHNLIDSDNMFGNTEGIYIDSSDSNIINNTITYNNTALGINIISSKFTTINNNQSYNNDGIGIHMDNSSNTSINNTLVYNNNEDGIYGENGSEYTTINNAEIFNNNYNGIYGADAKGIISNVRVYNNGGCGYNRSNDVYYYNENHFISNQNGNICSSNFIPGGGSDYPSLGWNDGDIYDEGENYRASYMILSWDYFMNPKNIGDEYLLPWRNSDYSQLIGHQTFNDDLPITYSYGSGILLQRQPVLWNTNPTLTTGLTFDTNRYIGGNTIKYDGDLEVDSITRTTPMTVTGTANTSEISGYNIYGSDLDSSYTTMPINTNTQIEFTVGDGIKKIITQIYSPIYFATHFEKSTILDTTPPTGTIRINTGAAYTYNANTTLALSANDANGVTQMQFSCNASSWTTPEAYSTSKSFNITNQTAAGCSAGDGTKRVYVRYKDTIGNRSTAIAGDIILNTILDCAAGRDNNNFITSSFRAGSPTNDNIICALYGSGVGDTTAYTQFWTGRDTTQCSGIQMNVIYTGNLSLTTLASNTIYVLTDNTSIGNGTTSLSNCTAVISNQTTGTTFYSTTGLTAYYNNCSMFYATTTNNIIFDNISIDGTDDGNGGNHSINSNGIFIMNAAKNTTINNVQIYNNQSAGIYSLFGPTNNHINNSKLFNNNYGVFLRQGQDNLINNSQFFNNVQMGINTRSTINSSINNTQTYNNQIGILLETSSTNNTINNTQIYNNGDRGIYLSDNSSGNNLYNNKIYNNISGIFLDASATNNKYYGTNILFNNGQNIGGTITNLTTGSSSDYPGIFSNGTLSTVGTMSRDYITNPINANSTYLLPWTGTWAGIRGQKTFSGSLPIRYSYGSGILTQIQPIYYSGASLKTGGIFDATKYIGSDTIKVTGDLLGLDTITSSSLSITGISSNGLINRYSIFGDINNMIGQTINTSTGITINTGLSINRIVTQLYYSPAGYFATHFEKDIEISSPIIYFTGSTPTSGTTITGNNFKPQIEMITTGGLATFNYIFSGITYPYYDSGLVLMMNFDNVTALGETAGGIIKDFSQYGNNGSVIGQTIWTGNGRRNGAYIFNGTGTNTFNGEIAIYGITTPQYLSSRGTIAYWINITKKDIGQGIFHLFEDSNPTTKYIRNYISGNNFIDLVIENEDTTELNVTYDLDNLGIIENQWIYIAWTQDGNGVKLYINGQEKTLGGTNTGIRWTDHLTGTKIITIGSARGTFSGAIDELRIYNRALTSGQILQMRRSNFQKYDTDKWRFTDDRQCMGSGSYTYSGYVMNTLGLSATTGRFNLISLINPFVTAADYFIGTTGVSTTQRTLSGQFTGYFTVDDWKGATGWHSTIQLPLTMTGVNYSTNKIINDGTNIKFMAAGLAVTGSNTGNLVYINPDLNSYTGFTAPKQYIQRDYSQGYSCPSGIYGNKPHISIDIPGYQNPDTYNGMITIDMDQ